MINNKINPWAGPSSYQDPEIAKEKLLFCGRDREIYDVTKLIDDSLFITLYGMSGIGKTSLMNAGVFPKLRTMQYLPISIRLFVESQGVYEDVIIRDVKSAIGRISGHIETIPVIQEAPKISADDYLWHFFATHRFYNQANQIVFPVIVLDQFEEILRQKDTRSRAESLLANISYMADESHAISDCVVDGVEYSYDFNFRFVLSIREDELYRLEDCIDNCYLPTLKQNRFRLCSLSVEDARDIITLPCPGLIADEQIDIFINKLKEDDIVNPALLSLYLYLYYEQGGEYTTKDLFSEYYKDATKHIDSQTIKNIEDKLLSDGGHRILIPHKDLLTFVPKEVIDHLIKSKILEKDGDYIEFSHDVFCPVIKERKEQREMLRQQEAERIRQEEEKRKLQAEAERRQLEIEEKAEAEKKKKKEQLKYLGLCLLVSVICTIVSWGYYKEAIAEKIKAEQSEQKAIAEKIKAEQSEQKAIAEKIKAEQSEQKAIAVRDSLNSQIEENKKQWNRIKKAEGELETLKMTVGGNVNTSDTSGGNVGSPDTSGGTEGKSANNPDYEKFNAEKNNFNNQ